MPVPQLSSAAMMVWPRWVVAVDIGSMRQAAVSNSGAVSREAICTAEMAWGSYSPATLAACTK